MTALNSGAQPGTPQQTVIEAALVLLERMGLSPADLAAAGQGRPDMPTFAEYVPVVSATVSAGTRRAYGSYWKRIVDHWGGRRLDEPTPSEIEHLMAYVREHVVARRNARGGRSAAEHLVAALRCLYRHAENDQLIRAADNPARKVAKPRRLPSTRRAMPNTRLAEINEVAATTGDDPDLDSLLLRLHTETACRRGGALALRPDDLDPAQCLIFLREKGETTRWQPVSRTLMSRLIQHGEERHAPHDGQLLRYRNGQPITSRRYDHLWNRVGRHLPWVHTQQITTHWIRHSFAMRTLEYLVSGHYRQIAELAKATDDGTGPDPALMLYLTKADPLLVLRDLLGHSTVLTTEKYLRKLDTTRIYRDAYEHSGLGGGQAADAEAQREADAEFACHPDGSGG